MSLNNILTKIEKANKIEEIKLSSQKVNLSIKDDVEVALENTYATYNKVDVGIEKFYNELFAAKKTYESARTEINNLLNAEKKLEDLKVKMLQMGKDLGIDVSGSSFYKDLQVALSRFNDIKAEIKTAEATYKGIKI